jgi:hypothetical protein
MTLPAPDLLLINGEHIYNLIGTDGVSAWYQEPFSGVTVQSYTLPSDTSPVASWGTYMPWLWTSTVQHVPQIETPDPVAPTPEPGTGILFAAALTLSLIARRFRS